MYDGAQIILVTDESGSLTDRFLVGPDTDQILASEDGAGDVRWYLADQQGTIRDVAEYDSGTEDTSVVNHVKYDSFGRITAQSDDDYQPLFAYTGLMWDADSGLQYSRARWYDPTIGRFLSEDPLGFAAGDANLTRYVGNAPTNYVDPTGTTMTDPRAMAQQYLQTMPQLSFPTGQGQALMTSASSLANSMSNWGASFGTNWISIPVGFAGGTIQAGANLGGMLIDPVLTVRSMSSTFSSYYNAGGGGINGTLLGLSGVSRLAALAEAWYRTNIVTGQTLTPDEIVDSYIQGIGGVGTVILTVAGPAAAVRTPTTVARPTQPPAGVATPTATYIQSTQPYLPPRSWSGWAGGQPSSWTPPLVPLPGGGSVYYMSPATWAASYPGIPYPYAQFAPYFGTLTCPWYQANFALPRGLNPPPPPLPPPL